VSVDPVEIQLPYRFDTSTVWHTILKGAVGFNALLIACIALAAMTRPWPVTAGLALVEIVVFGFTQVFFRFQEGSIGTLEQDRITVEPNVLLGVTLPGPSGSYALDRFSAIRVEFRYGPVEPGVQGGPNEVIWLVGKPPTPNVAVAHTDHGEGPTLGRQLAALLKLPVEEAGAANVIHLTLDESARHQDRGA